MKEGPNKREKELGRLANDGPWSHETVACFFMEYREQIARKALKLCDEQMDPRGLLRLVEWLRSDACTRED